VEFPADLPAEICFLRNFMRFSLRNKVSCGIFATTSLLFSTGNSAGKFPADFKNRRKQLPTKVLAGNQNPQEISQETYFLRILGPNPQEKRKFLVV
jgi:hypothetical protein